MKKYQILESTSEMKLKIFGSSISELFTNSLFAMFDAIKPQYSQNAKVKKYKIALFAPDKEILLVDFLSEALFYSDKYNMAFFNATFDKLYDNELKAIIFGKKVEGFTIEIKAVTYHDIQIREKNGLFNTEVLFDI